MFISKVYHLMLLLSFVFLFERLSMWEGAFLLLWIFNNSSVTFISSLFIDVPFYHNSRRKIRKELVFTIAIQAIITVALNSFKICSFHFTFWEKKRRSGLPEFRIYSTIKLLTLYLDFHQTIFKHLKTMNCMSKSNSTDAFRLRLW